MQYLELTCPTLAENIALDEALLLEAEARGGPGPVLRVWEASQPAVILGRASRAALEVNAPACQERGIPIVRRTSGGATVMVGPGCLMYAVVLSFRQHPEIRALDQAHRLVLDRLARALQGLGIDAACAGTSDLVCGGRKFSGNSLRLKREHLLYHGTLLYDFPLALIETCLRMPPRRPGYRRDRAHGDFLMNLPVARDRLLSALIETWQASKPRHEWPRALTAQLVREKYALDEWNGDPAHAPST